MKKALGLILLLLANVIMLAHTSIPHHHHDQIPVAIINDTGHSHDGENHHHHHHDNNIPVEQNSSPIEHSDLTEDCLLSATYIRFDNNLSLLKSFFSSAKACPLFLLPFEIHIPQNDYGELPFREKPYIVHYYQNFVSQSIGLRAPPFC
ncbi:MAG: hypothetical protein BGO33_13385 [Bacteroidia bacterium 43-41]|nr:MAG: hypothetical protein BGO33_13385 [Bacteroidia bacterium 43-41]